MPVTESSQWSNLPSDILKSIANLLNTNADVDILHNLRLRSVCKQWRSSISPPNRPNVLIPFPISATAAQNPSRSGYFNLSVITTYLLHQPPLQQSSSSSSNNCKYWLLRVEYGNIRNLWNPLNPLSGLPKGFPRSINLLNFCASPIATSHLLHFFDPTEASLKVGFNKNALYSPKKVVLSTSGPLVAIAIYGLKLYSLKVGDEKWKPVDDSHYDDVVFHKGKFYAAGINGRIVSVVGSDLKAFEIVRMLSAYIRGRTFKNLVVSNGELFLIDKYYRPVYYDEELGAYMKETGFVDEIVASLKIYRLNEEKRQWEWIIDLGDRVFFIGNDCSYSISVNDFPGLKPNCVYYRDNSFSDVNDVLEDEDEFEGFGEFVGDTGVYCLDNRRCGPLAIFPDHWSPFWPPPTGLKPKALKSNR